MIPASIPANENERQASLDRMDLVSTPREVDLDRITRLAKTVFGAEVALISLVDRDRQWFKSRIGISVTETPRDISFCGHAINGETALVVNDALDDQRFCDNPLVVSEPNVRFYAGQPLINSEGHCIGTLCVVSSQARGFNEDERQSLADLGRLTEVVLEARRLSEAQRALMVELDNARRDALIDPLTGLWNRRGIAILFEKVISQAIRHNEPLGVGLVDVDHFKRINDEFGHKTGDEAISLAGETIQRCARSHDVIGRYGGDEFILVFRAGDFASLSKIGEKLISAFRNDAKLCVSDDAVLSLTASIGLTVAQPKPGLSSHALVDAADQALYRAKRRGRDRFEVLAFEDSVREVHSAAE